MSQKSTDMEKQFTAIKGETSCEGFFVTDPAHGGKVTCRRCSSFIDGGHPYFSYNTGTGEKLFWCEPCFNRYEPYYDLDKPID